MMRPYSPPVLLAVLALAAGLLTAVAAPAAADQSSSAHRRVAAASVAAGDRHTCVVTAAGAVRCWGDGASGRLGYGNTIDRGDNEHPALAGDVDLGGKALAVTAGSEHTCALLTAGRVRCWGEGSSGQLGYGSVTDVGDNEAPVSVGNVPLGGKAVAVAAGAAHTCAVLTTGKVRCWGEGDHGRLGYAATDDIGDDETPGSVGNVPLGGKATAVTAGAEHSCALLTTGKVRCWGRGFAGRLGYAAEDDLGDDESPASAGDVVVGGKVVAISAGARHTCAVLAGGRVRCWGQGLHGRLGYGNGTNIGNNETPASAGDVELYSAAAAVAAGGEHTCVALGSGKLHCFGRSLYGQLGYGNQDAVGDDETPADAGLVPVLESVRAVAAGTDHTCAIVADGHVRCWGAGDDGRLGLADTDDVGDGELALEGGRVQVGGTVRAVAATTLTLTRKPGRDRKAPYVYRVRGRVNGAFVVDAATCAGKVRVTVTRKNGMKVAGRTVRLNPTCRYRARLTVAGGKVPPGKRVRLTVRARLLSTPDLAPATRTTTVRAR
ncbi:hypothetical protein [Nocardioides sp. TF02-7]|uniref:RCC1 domain-containing protein n=1 Tax=Nocardioides sp. TF02-7 TaxID=2917724 RepID=UPI001F07029A|nr:hypothetical protein [Nocardioides sp. TF02-7]UMG93360.1 hypothetical protein MF408_03555 [Nocardioides sp. TF02-7]